LPTDKDIISNLYVNVNASKSFKEFYSDFHNFRQYSNNYLITDDFVIFDNIKPTITTDLKNQYLTLHGFYKYSRENKKLENIISIFKYKFETITKIRTKKEDKTISIYNPYKEFSRVITYPETNDFTHLLTITYRHGEGTTEHNSKNEIFNIMEDNRKLRKKVNNGIHRIRSYIYKKLKDELKKKFNNKELLNKKVRELKNIVFKYFKVYELHQSNHLHAHFLIKLPHFITKKDFKEIIKKIADWFETEKQGIDLKRLKTGNDRNRARRYVLKYMFKQFRNNNLFYVENEKNEKIYFIRKDAIIRNDIPRMTSKSRNIKAKRFKPFFTITDEQQGEELKSNREITRFKRDIIKKEIDKFKSILEQFKTKNQKRLEREIEEAEKRTEVIEKMTLFLENKYHSINGILKCLDYSSKDKIIQDRYKELYYLTQLKFNKELEELERLLYGNDDEDDYIDF